MRSMIAIGIVACSLNVHANEFTGTVVKVHDGDTAHVEKEDGTVEKIRFLLCDTPEIGQAHGTEARDFVSGLINGKEVTVKWDEKDQYGRVLGEIFLGGESINRKIIAEGHGWWFYHYNDDFEVGTLEAKAKAAKKGLWKAEAPLYPRSWRRGARLNAEVGNPGSGGTGISEESESTILIMALMPNPTGRDENNETVILANNSNVEVSIDQWRLKDDDNGIFVLSGTIPAGGTRTIRLNSSL